MLHQKIPKSLPTDFFLAIMTSIVVLELALGIFAIQAIWPLAGPVVERSIEDFILFVSPPEEVAVISTPAPTLSPTLTPAPSITPTPPITINPDWIEIPLPQSIEIGACIQEENGILYLAAIRYSDLTFDGLWKYAGNSWEFTQVDPATRFPTIWMGEYSITVKEKDGVMARLIQAEEDNWDSWALQMTQDQENWTTIRFPPIAGFMPVDYSYDFVVEDDEITIYLAGGNVWQTTINLP